MKEIICTLIRNIGKIGGPLLAAKGVGDESSWETIGGAVSTLVAVIWGIMDARSASQAKKQVKAQNGGAVPNPTFAKTSQTNIKR